MNPVNVSVLTANGHLKSHDRQSANTAAIERQTFAEMARQAEAALMRVALRLCKGGHDCAQELVQEASTLR